MKYLGGKQRLGKHLYPVLREKLEQYNEKNEVPLEGYMEPFCGSLGVLKHFANEFQNGEFPVYANDYHPDLICMWKAVQEGTLEYPEAISEEEFLAAKELKSPNAMKAFVGFGMSFGGRFFAAYSQKYLNGKKEDFCREMVRSLQRTKPMIEKVTFTNDDYLSFQPKNMFLYCDPPYEYNKYPVKYRRETKVYDVFDNKKFWETMREWSNENLVFISEVKAPDDFIEVWQQVNNRTAAQSEKTRYKSKTTEKYSIEKLFVWKDGKSAKLYSNL